MKKQTGYSGATVTDKTKTELTAYLAAREDIAFGVLFGSAAKGRRTKESDTDIALYFVAPEQEGPPPLQVEVEAFFQGEEAIWRELERIVGTEVDLVVLNRAPATVAAAAITEGETLLVADASLFLRYMLAVTQQAADFRIMLRELLEVRKRSSSLSENDRYRLERIAQYLRDELSDAELYVGVTRARYLEDAHFRRALERWVENLVNASIDIAKIIVGAEGLPIPQTYRETLSSLVAVEPFASLADDLARNARIRNAPAHEYLDMRYREVARIGGEATELYGSLAEATENYGDEIHRRREYAHLLQRVSSPGWQKSRDAASHQ